MQVEGPPAIGEMGAGMGAELTRVRTAVSQLYSRLSSPRAGFGRSRAKLIVHSISIEEMLFQLGKCPSGAEETAIQVVYTVIISL